MPVLLLFVAGVACFVRDARVNGPRRGVDLVAHRIDLERMFALPARVPNRHGRGGPGTVTHL